MQEAGDRLLREGIAMAGGLGDLARRAAVYYHLYEDSGGRNVFPLIAAHGALWGSGYFARGLRFGRLCSFADPSPSRRRHRYQALSTFADAFREINRRVCAQAYTLYHHTRLHGRTHFSEAMAPPELLDALLACHASVRTRDVFTSDQRAALFRAFFLWEQHHIVSPAVDRAVAAFDWPRIKALAMQPTIQFRYFPPRSDMCFRDFSSQNERIEKGLRAYQLAEQVGMARVESELRGYEVLPPEFFGDSIGFFRSLAVASGM